jgi:hypothetical protein
MFFFGGFEMVVDNGNQFSFLLIGNYCMDLGEDLIK